MYVGLLVFMLTSGRQTMTSSLPGPLGKSVYSPSTEDAWQHVRAVPCSPGSAVLFSHRVVHWGSRGRPGSQQGQVTIAKPILWDRKQLASPSLLQSLCIGIGFYVCACTYASGCTCVAVCVSASVYVCVFSCLSRTQADTQLR